MPNPNLMYGQFGVQQPQVDVPGLSGYAQGQALNQYMQNRDLQNTLNNLIIQANQAQMQEYGANAPVREMERSLALEYKPRETAADVGTKEERLKQEQIKTPGLAGKEQIEKLERDVQSFGLMLPTFQGPTASKDFGDWAESQGWKKEHPARQMLERATSPQDFQARGQYFLQQASRNLSQRRAETQTLQETGSRERIADIGGQYSLERQRLANEAAERVQQMKTDKEKRIDKLEGDLVRLLEERRATKDSKKIETLDKNINQLFQMIQMIKSAGAPYIPGLQYQGAPLMQPRQAQPVPGTEGAPIQWERGPDGKPRPVQR